MKTNYFKKIKVVGTLFFGILMFQSNAQTSNSKIVDKEGNVTVTQPTSKVNNAGKGQAINTSTTTNQSGYTLNEDDVYQGRTNEILYVLTVDKIPADFPKYVKGMGIQWYNDQMEIYYRLHPSILKDHYRKKLGI